MPPQILLLSTEILKLDMKMKTENGLLKYLKNNALKKKIKNCVQHAPNNEFKEDYS